MNEITQIKLLSETLKLLEAVGDPAAGEAMEIADYWTMDDSVHDLAEQISELIAKYNTPLTQELESFMAGASIDDPAEMHDGLKEIAAEFGGVPSTPDAEPDVPQVSWEDYMKSSAKYYGTE